MIIWEEFGDIPMGMRFTIPLQEGADIDSGPDVVYRRSGLTAVEQRNQLEGYEIFRYGGRNEPPIEFKDANGEEIKQFFEYECVINLASSRACERGAKCCIIEHPTDEA